MRITADFPTETLKARAAWKDVFQALKENVCPPRLCYLAKLSFKGEREIKTFHDEQKLKEATTAKDT
jgi:hypothetical protein